GQHLRRRRGRRSVDVAGRGHGCPDAFTHRLHDLEDAGPPRRARDLHAVTRYDGLRRLRRLAVDLHMTAATRGGRLGPCPEQPHRPRPRVHPHCHAASLSEATAGPGRQSTRVGDAGGRPLERPGVPMTDAATALETILDDRHSCRGFTGEPVPEETIERILRMAQRTASWCNSQAWQVDLVSGPATEAFATALTDWVVTHEMRSDLPAPERYEGMDADRRRASAYGR